MVPSVMRNSSFFFLGNVRSIKVSDSYEFALVGRRRYFLWDCGRKLDRATHIVPFRGPKKALIALLFFPRRYDRDCHFRLSLWSPR
jgi:hypothetical protein